MIVETIKRLSAQTTEEEWDIIDKCQTLLEDIIATVRANNCKNISIPDYDGATIDYTIEEIKNVIEILNNIKDMEEIY